MAKKFLLPKVNRDRNFPEIIRVNAGLQEINQDVLKILYAEDNIETSGVPYLFAHPFVFSKQLERSTETSSEVFKQFSTLVRGIFLGVIKVEFFPLSELGTLGHVAREFLEKEDEKGKLKSFAILTWKDKIVGGIYPECFVFPRIYAPEEFVAVHRKLNAEQRVIEEVTKKELDEQLSQIEVENEEKEQRFGGSDIARGLFKYWFEEVKKNYLGSLSEESLPLWARKLQTLITRWDILAVSTQELVEFGKVEVFDENNKLVSVPLVCVADYYEEEEDFKYEFFYNQKLESDEAVAIEEFSTLIKGLFLGTIEVKQQKEKDQERDILVYKDTKVGYISQKCLVFPVPTDHAQKLLTDITRENGEKEKNFGIDVVKGLFQYWYNEITYPLRREKEETWPLWAKNLRDHVWEGFLEVNTEGLSAEELEKVTEVQVIGIGENEISVIFRRIQGYDHLFCKRVILFKNGKMPDLPIKSEYLDQIEVERTLQLQNEGERSQGVYTIQLKNRTEPIKHTVEIFDGDEEGGFEASILLWPSFKDPNNRGTLLHKDPNWTTTYVLFQGSTHMRDKQPFIKFLTVQDTEQREAAEEDACILHDLERKRITIPFEYVEFFFQDGSGEPESMGIFKDPRRPADFPNTPTVDIALDFGTSNSCLAIKKNLNVKQDRVIELEDKTFDLLESYFDQDKIHRAGIWFPTYGAEKPLKTIPSEILFDNFRQKTSENLDKPLSAYSIPHPNYEREGEYNNVLSNFKLEDPFTKNPNDLTTALAYLKILMQMALATLRDEPYLTNTVNLRVTYPLAFGKPKHDIYCKLLEGDLKDEVEGLLVELHKETGIMVSLSPPGELIPESFAGKSAFLQSGYQLIVDIGGGTTDIALGEPGQPLLAVDSIQYAGNQYVELLVDKYLPAILKRDSGSNREAKLIQLNKEIRRGGFQAILKLYQDPDQQYKAIEALADFYEGLFEYLGILIKGCDINKGVKISFYPLGNGWLFAEAIPETGGLDNYIKTWFHEKNIAVQVVGEGEFGRKGAVAIGALNEQVGSSGSHLSEHPIISRVGCEVTVKYKNDEPVEIPADSEVPCYLTNMVDSKKQPLIETDPFFKEFIKHHRIWGQKEIDEGTVVAKFNPLCLKALKYNRIKKCWMITRSLFTIFLEEIFPKYYLEQ